MVHKTIGMDYMKLRRTLIDNSDNGYKMTEAIRACLHDENVIEVCIATGFWDLRGTALIYEELADFLSRENSKFRLLIGKDPYLYTSDTESYTKGRYDKQEQAWRVELDDFHAQEQYIKVVQMLVDNLKDDNNERFQIHVYNPDGELKDQFLHSKCYIFKGQDNEDRDVGYGIIGSSNLTRPGMEENSELNILEVEARDIINTENKTRDKTHLQWFNEKWEDSVSWEKEFLLQITQSKMGPNIHIPEPKPTEDLNSPLTPYELYIKFLQTRFGDIVDVDTSKKIESYLPTRYTALQYQIEAVTQCYNIMQKHNGFMLADVVGLGKTVVGAMLIKHFLSLPDKDSREHKVLIVTPPAIKKGWEETIADFDKDSNDKIGPYITFITTGSISNLVDDEDEYDDGDFNEEIEQVNYGLILVDESHKFRNSETKMYRLLDDLIGNISQVAPQPYVGLLSATPQNNAPNDLRNQLYLFERTHNACTLDGDARNLEHFFAEISQRYKVVMKGVKRDPVSGEEIALTPGKRKEELKAISTEIRTNVLDQILVRRTRTDVKMYKENKLVFPDVASPIALEYQLNKELADLFKDTMECIAPDIEHGELFPTNVLGYYRYRAIQYLNKHENKERYRGKGSLDSDRIANQLATIMRILLVKRLESSKDAFTKSLSNLLQYTNNMIKMWENGIIFICPKFDVNKEFESQSDWNIIASNIRAKIEKLNKEGRNEKQSNAEYVIGDFKEEFIKLLRNDRDILQSLVNRWNAIKSDPKKTRFRKELRHILPESEPTKKLVIFTESADTLECIAEVVEEEIGKPLCITAKNLKEKQQVIRENFDANYGKKEGETQKDDYQVIISTDVLAEGVNLHRAYTIINYDTPWNSTKLMQRIGRVNRIGSESSCIYIYNFMPCDEGNKRIRLFERAFTKLQSFHTLFGEDSQVFSTDEEITHYDQDFSKLIDGEESPMMKYLFKLREYKKANPLRYDMISKKETGLEVATSGEQKESLLVIRNKKTSGMYVATNVNGDRNMISIEDMLVRFNPGVSAVSVDLPEGIDDIKRRAIRTFTREFDSLRLRRAQSKQNDARNTIVAITDKYPNLSANAIDLLSQARELVDRGNLDICNSIMKIGKYLNIDNPELFPLSDTEIEDFIQSKLQNLDQRLQDEVGKGEVYMALYKI